MSRCVFCDTSVARKHGIFCSGQCKNLFHFGCVNVPSELVTYLNSVAGLQWKCPECRNLESKGETKKILETFDKRCNDFIVEITGKFQSLKNDVVSVTSGKIASFNRCESSTLAASNQPTYAEVSRQMQKIVVKPLNPNQSCSSTKADLLQVMNPANLNAQIGKVKHTRDGGIVLGSSQSDTISHLKEIVEKELSSKYEVHQLKNILPQVRIVGLSACYNNETLKNLLVKQNADIFSDSSNLNIVRTWPTKKNNTVFQALVQVDVDTFNCIISRKHILVGLDSCSVYEAFDIPRCFNCCSFFHTKRLCKNDTKCPICCGNHEVKNCSTKDNYQCINCFNLKKTHKVDLNTNHAAWDYENCFAYKKAISKFKTDVLGTPNK